MIALTLKSSGSPEMRAKAHFGARLVDGGRRRPGVWVLDNRPMAFPEVVRRASAELERLGHAPIDYVTTTGSEPTRCRVPNCHSAAQVCTVLTHPLGRLRLKIKAPLCRRCAASVTAAQLLETVPGLHKLVKNHFATRGEAMPPAEAFVVELLEMGRG